MASADFENDGRKYQVNETLETDQGNMVVSAVSYQEGDEGVRKNFSYILRHQEDIDAEAKAIKDAEAAAAKAQAEANKE